MSAGAATQIAGAWLGTLNVGTTGLRVQFRISEGPGGVLTGRMDSLDQGAKDIPVDVVTLTGDKLHMEVKMAHSVYEGTLDATGAKVDGSWSQGAMKLPLTLKREQAAPTQQEAAASSDTAVEARAKQFVTLLAERKFPQAVDCFDATMKAALPAEKLEQAWAGQLKEGGAFRALGAVRTQHAGPYEICFVGCQLEKKGITVQVVFGKDQKVSGLFFRPGENVAYQAPGYVRPAQFQEKEVVVGAGEWSLPGTLAIPVGKGPFPAVVLVHGSGPIDRDETVGGNKPFRDLAWGLASQGIAVLRYEKRTKQHASKLAGALSGLTVKEETVADALAAVDLLRKTEGIDKNRVFVLGHSLGGMLVPRIAAGDQGIAGFIVMAGAARPLEDMVLEQTQYQLSLQGELSPEAKKKLEEVRSQVAAVKALSRNDSSSSQVLGAPPGYWLDLKGYNPPTAAAKVTKPMLILQGEQDCQVSLTKDFPLWRQALADKKDAAFRSYPNLNHLFAEVKGKSTGEEYLEAGHVAENVVSDVAAFVKQH